MTPRDIRYTVSSLPMQAGSVPAPAPSPSPTPIIALENVPSTLTVNVQAAAQLRNVGTVNATWSLVASGSLTVTPDSGTLAPGATLPLVLEAFGAGNCALVLTVTNGSATGTPASIVASGVVPPPPPAPTLSLSALGGLTTQVGVPLSFGVVLNNPGTLPLVGTPENVSGSAVFVPTTVSWSLGDLNKAFAATWAAAGSASIRVTAPGGLVSNILPVTVTAAPPPPPPPAPTLATLSGSNSATAGVAHVDTVSLDVAADQNYTVTWSRSDGATGPATSTIATGQTSANGSSTWGSGAVGSGRTVDFTISPSLTRAGRPLSVTVAPSGLATTATLSLPSTGTTGSVTTGTVTLNGTSPATGSITITGGAGATVVPSTLSWSSGEAGSVKSFTVSYAADGVHSVSITSGIAGVTAAGTPASHTTGAAYSNADWVARKSGPAVIAAHAFDYDAEVTQHLVGSTDVRDHPVPVRRVVDDAGFGCLEQVVIGAELKAPFTAGSSTMDISDAYLWPDPAVTGPFYFMVAKAYPSTQDKNLFLCTAMTPLYPKGARLTVAYQAPLGSAFAATAQNYSVGDYAGNENSREWRRTFSALIAGDNGLPYDDPAASGAVPLRSKSASGLYGVPRDASYWQYGFYMHPDNAATWQNWTPWIGSTTYTPRGLVNGSAPKYQTCDGNEIFVQYRMKISRRFLLHHQQPDAETSYWLRKTFAFQSEVSSLNQLVLGYGPPNIYYVPGTPQFPFKLGTYKDARTVGADDYARSHVSYQAGSPWDVAPYYADLSSSGKPAVGAPTPDGSAAWKVPDEEWVTFLWRIKPGHSGIADTEIEVKFARQDHPDYNGTYTTILNVTDAKIVFSGSGDIDFPDGAFTSATVARMDALPGWQSFGLMGYLNLFQAAGWVPPKASYWIRLGQVVFSRASIPAPAATAKPSWLTAATARTWVNAPQTVNFASLDPVIQVPAIVPAGADWSVTGYARVFAWCGHTWDDLNRRFSTGYIGGHNDYGGNEVTRLNVRELSNWERVKQPSGALPGPALVSFSTNTSDESGRYPDGTLRSAHTYHNHKFIQGYGHTIVRQRGMYPFAADGVSSGLQRVWTIDPETGFDVERCDFRSISTGGSSESSFDLDTKRNVIWHIGSGTSKWVKFSNLSARTWTATDMSTAPGLPRDNYMPNSGVIRYVRSADRVAVFPSFGPSYGSGAIGIMNPNALTYSTPAMSGSFAAGFLLPDDLVGGVQAGCGFEWCEALGCFLLWNNTSNTTQISTLTPSNPADWTQPWVRGALTVAGANTVTPGVTANSGTFGRATYSAALNAFLVHPNVSAPVSVFKI